MLDQNQFEQIEAKMDFCSLANEIVEFATAGKIWLMSCLKEFGQNNSDQILIGGLCFRKNNLESLLERLSKLQNATSNDEVNELICEDMIPMGLLYKEALWKQFQDLIDLWCHYSYYPKPIDTSDVVLPEELLALTEKIAENVHDVWAYGRVAEGWIYGEKKDAERKTTPLLVPYDELPESEKEYDRNTAFETLKLVIKLGYSISRTDAE